MTTSVFNKRRRKRRAETKVLWRRRERHIGGDFTTRGSVTPYGYDPHPNEQRGRDQRGKDKK